MNTYKRNLGIIVLLFILILPMFADDNSAELVITTIVRETIDNTGIRITLDDLDISSNSSFDNKFLGASSLVTIYDTELDSSVDNITGKFSILVRRNNSQNMKVSVTANPLTNGSSFLGYSLLSSIDYDSGRDNPFSVSNSQAGARSYSIQKYNQPPIIRSQNIFTYTIPADMNAAAGTYTASIVFGLTTN